MKRFVLALLLISVCHSLAASADENVRAAQAQLRQEGFYFGDPTGVYNNQTAAAVTRYQIRHGLQITGQLDAPTAKALGTQPLTPADGGAPLPMSGTWRQLRNGEQQFVPAQPHSSPNVSSPAPGRPSKPTSHRSAPPPQTATPLPVTREVSDQSAFSRERLRDYIGAFILAGLDPKVGAELEFFADRVDYFDDGKLSREKIRRDLLRYDARWPTRRFWLAGDLDLGSESNQRLRVTFPIRYELRNRSERASGTVRKTLVLEKTANHDLEIVAVNEKKIR
jgi:hypothetical protein